MWRGATIESQGAATNSAGRGRGNGTPVATGVEACLDGFGTCEDGFDGGGRSRSGGGVGGRSAITAPKSRDDSEETSCDDS